MIYFFYWLVHFQHYMVQALLYSHTGKYVDYSNPGWCIQGSP